MLETRMENSAFKAHSLICDDLCHLKELSVTGLGGHQLSKLNLKQIFEFSLNVFTEFSD